jgi:hypothetical protein
LEQSAGRTLDLDASQYSVLPEHQILGKLKSIVDVAKAILGAEDLAHDRVDRLR